MNDTPPPGGTTDPGNPSTQTPPPPSGDGPRAGRDEMRDLARLRRSTTDRKIAGVAGGIARHLDIDPIVVRIALVVLVFFGGGGILLYGAAWLLVPDDNGDSVFKLDDRSRAVALAIVGVLAALSLVGDAFGGWDFPWPLAVAGIVIVVLLATGKGQKLHQHAMKHSWHGPGGWHGPQRMHGWQGAPADPAAATRPGYPAGQRLVGEDGEPLPPEAGEVPPYQPGPGYPSYQQPWRPPARDPRKKGPLLFGFAFALSVLALGALGTVDLAGADVTPSAYPATVMAVCGLMLVVGAFFGRAGGLILVGLAAAAVTAATSVTSSFSLDAGEIRTSPATADALADDYQLDIGDVRIDLTEIEDLEELDGRTLELDLRIGHLGVIVPDDGLTVVVEADIKGVGEAKAFGDKSGNTLDITHDGGARAPVLTIDAENYVGDIDIQTEGSTR